MLTLLSIIALLGYGISAFALLQQLLKNRLSHPAISAVPAFLAILSHAALLYRELALGDFHHFNIAASLAAVAWFIALLAFLRGGGSGNLLLKPVIYLFAALSCLLLAFAPAQWGTALSMNSGLLVHIVLSLLAYGVLALATFYILQASYVSKVLKRRQSSPLFQRLPPLMAIEQYFFRLLAVGTLLLLAALISGFVFLDDMFAQHVAHKTLLSIAAAVLYLIANIMHITRGSRGHVITILTVTASILLTLGYFGSRFVKDILLS